MRLINFIHDQAIRLPLLFGLAILGFVGPPLVNQPDSLANAQTAAEKRRAQQLFRNYCMDCHGPKLAGEKFDKTLLCPNVQGKDADSYRDAVEKGPDVMPAFEVSPSYISDGNLHLNYNDFILLTDHEATFQSNQP